MQLSSKADLETARSKETGRNLEILLKWLLSETPFTPCHIPLLKKWHLLSPILPSPEPPWTRVRQSPAASSHLSIVWIHKTGCFSTEGFSPVGFLGSPTAQPPAHPRRDGTRRRERRSAGEAASLFCGSPAIPRCTQEVDNSGSGLSSAEKRQTLHLLLQGGTVLTSRY